MIEQVARRALETGGRVLLLGAPGTGKSTLARSLGCALARVGHGPNCIGADPGLPGFGAPGAVCLAHWDGDDWVLDRVEAVCSLDAGRFRLPLAAGVGRLAEAVGDGPLVLDGPGVVRGVAGAELLQSIVAATGIDSVISLERAGKTTPLSGELRALGLPVQVLRPAEGAHRPGKPARARVRTRLWDRYLEHAEAHPLDLDSTPIVGTPPPLSATAQWHGRQGALIDSDGRTVALGEIEVGDDGRFALRCDPPTGEVRALLVRDAARDASGLLGSAGPDAADAVRYVAPADVLPDARSASGPRPVVRAGAFSASLVNGVLGDPLLHLRLHHRRRSLLFDLGEAGRLPARIVHQVSDVFLSHAHVDHIAGFLWLVRSRLGALPTLRVFGPPGIAGHLRGLLGGVLWDRIGERGPRFEVAELDGDELRRVHLQGGGDERALEPRAAPGGVLLDEDDLEVRAVSLDHGHDTRVLAFALETRRTLNVRKERLEATGLAPGPWLTELKRVTAAGDPETAIELPDGRREAAGSLATELLIDAPGVKLAYATDLADTEPNRAALAGLAAGAHTLFCEASFAAADVDQASRTGHLTTRACAAIAARAGVERLVPFHFSRRYERDLAPLYDELRAGFARTITPALRDAGD